MVECMPKECEILQEVSKFTYINTETKEVYISDNLLSKLNKKQLLYLQLLQNGKYSLQYIIE